MFGKDRWLQWGTLLSLVITAGIAAPARLDAAEGHRMKRIVICLDGTWNSPEQDKDGGKGLRPRYKPTNVLKTFRAILPTAEDGAPQIAFYLEGVGSSIGEPARFAGLQKWTDKLLGGAFGGGFEARIKSAFRFLVANYEPGDKIYVFGFSRGAAQAQSLVRFIDWNGGLLHKGDEFYIPELFQGYRESAARSGASAGIREAIRRRRGKPEAILDPQPVEITFLGVYDTVLAVGTRLGADRDEEGVPTVKRKYAFHVGPQPPAIVKTVRHALAIDEQRWDFRPQIWRSAAPGQSLEQRWFPGAHSNAGGGYDPDGIANFAFRWMISEAERAESPAGVEKIGLEVNKDLIGKYPPNPKGVLGDEHSRGNRIVEFLRGKRGQGRRSLRAVGAETVTVSEAAFRVMIENPAYRPQNLLEDVRRHPEDLDVLRPADRARIEAILAETK